MIFKNNAQLLSVLHDEMKIDQQMTLIRLWLTFYTIENYLRNKLHATLDYPEFSWT